jgi:hypothetical protein
VDGCVGRGPTCYADDLLGGGVECFEPVGVWEGEGG